MKIKIFFLSLLLIGTSLFPAYAFAQTASSGSNIVLERNRTVNENYFATGENVTLSGTVNGDAYVAGGNLYVDGTINGDLMIAGGQVNIDGVVAGDVRAAGGQININGQVQGNVTVAGGSVSINRSAVIGRGLVAGAGQLVIQAPITGGITMGAGSATIASTVGGNVLAGVGEFTLAPESAIAGNLVYMSERQANMQEGSSVAGNVNFTPSQKGSRERDGDVRGAAKAAGGFMLAYKMLAALTALLIGWLITTFFPVFSRYTIQAAETRPLKSFFTGFLVLFFGPLAVIVLFMTILGAPLGFLLIALYFAYIWLSKIFFSLYIGKKISDILKSRQSLFAYLFLGLAAWVIASSLPILGWIYGAASLFMGIGALVLTKRYYWTMLRERKLV